MAGVAGMAGSLLWYYYLRTFSPAAPTHEHVVGLNEHGIRFFVRPWESHLIGMLAAGGLALVLLVAWIDWRDAKRHGRLKPYSPLPELGGRPKADPRDIFTYSFGFYVAAWIVLGSLAVATGGEIPFGLFQGGQAT